MVKEQPPKFYTGKGYLRAGKERYAQLYAEIIKLLPKPMKCPTIVDFGCGVGYFAGKLAKKRYTRYIGIDFSEHMINHARKFKPQFEYVLMNLYDEDLKDFIKEYRIFTMLETLEHINNDIDVLNKIPKGSLIIGSVPGSEAAGHVRVFKGIADVVERYSEVIEFNFFRQLNIKKKTPNRITIFRGIKK